MTTLTTYTTKTSALTKAEADANFDINATAKTALYTVAEADNRDIIECSGTFTVTLPVAATIAAAADTGDFEVTIKNSGTGYITVARSSTDTIDGETSIGLQPNQSQTYKVNQAQDGYNIIASHDKEGFGVVTVNTGTSVEIFDFDPLTARKVTLTLDNINLSSASTNINIQLGDASGWKTTVYFGESQITQTSGITYSGLSTGAPITGVTGLSTANNHFGHVIWTNKSGTDRWHMTAHITEYGGSKTYFSYAYVTLDTSALTRMRILSGGFDGSGTVTYLIE